MRIEDMNREEKVQKTYRDLQSRKQAKKVAMERAASDAMAINVDNIFKVKRKQYHSRINKFTKY